MPSTTWWSKCSWTTGPRPPRSVHRVPSSVRSVSSPLEFGALSPLGWLLQIINIFINPSALPFELPSFRVRTSHETVVLLQNYNHKSFSPRCPGAHEECGIRGATFGTSGGARCFHGAGMRCQGEPGELRCLHMFFMADIAIFVLFPGMLEDLVIFLKNQQFFSNRSIGSR